MSYKKHPKDSTGCHKCFTKILGIGMLMNSLSSSQVTSLHIMRLSKPEGQTAFHMVPPTPISVFSSGYAANPKNKTFISNDNLSFFRKSCYISKKSMLCFKHAFSKLLWGETARNRQ